MAGLPTQSIVDTAGTPAQWGAFRRVVGQYIKATYQTWTTRAVSADYFVPTTPQEWAQRLVDDLLMASYHAILNSEIEESAHLVTVWNTWVPDWQRPEPIPTFVESSKRWIEDNDPSPPTTEAPTWPSDRSTRSAATSSETVPPSSRPASSRRRTTAARTRSSSSSKRRSAARSSATRREA